MFPTEKSRNGTLAPLFADLFQEFLDRGSRVPKSPPESHIECVECVGDSKDAGPLRASASTSVKPLQLETRKKEGSVEASVPSQRKRSILTTESKTNPLYKEKLRQRLKLVFAPDMDISPRPTKQAMEPRLGNKLTPSSMDSARLETRLDALTKRMLTLETNMDSTCYNFH
ncbi:hypothetical protein KR038_004909 [Drosophila bunnanda]|nr:hypothetical protein KR038_004909 [Drosophila bunnanda]